MSKLAARRWRNGTIAVLLTGAILGLYWLYAASLAEQSYPSGWFLLGLMILLSAYNFRKKLPFLPLGSSAAWLQMHLYAGWLTMVLFLVHLGFRAPTGWLEGGLALLYVAVAASGVGGIMLSRIFAPRLTSRGESVLYERIPALCEQLRGEAEQLAIQSVAESDTTTIGDFYTAKLLPFFEGPTNFFGHLLGSSRPSHALLRELDSLHRYLRNPERKILDQIAQLVRAKSDLDFQYAVQSMLKWWLFVHIPLTYALLIVTAVHVILVYAFSGGPG